MKVQQLSFKHHAQATHFFKDLSFELAPGKMHALHGKNGVGKSVLLNLLNGKIPPHGVIEGIINGNEETMLVNQRFDFMIADQFSFLDNLKFATMSSFPLPFMSLRKPKLYPELIKKFHIDLYKPVWKLSGGQRQILALLMVLQQERKILLLDEPTATLDEDNARMVFEFLKDLTSQNMTLLVVCHDNELTLEYANGNHFYLEITQDGARGLRYFS